MGLPELTYRSLSSEAKLRLANDARAYAMTKKREAEADIRDADKRIAELEALVRQGDKPAPVESAPAV